MTEFNGGHDALLVLLAGTIAILGFTAFWGLSNSRPIRNRRAVTGRAAAPYWHSPTGLQDERQIAPWADRPRGEGASAALDMAGPARPAKSMAAPAAPLRGA